ncbi:MAG TPA: hypothetical protein DCM32_06365, partial [Xanthomonadaceae bacterium]|nr:hypothetical protein [Xanthomonadaceae bacterium]
MRRLCFAGLLSVGLLSGAPAVADADAVPAPVALSFCYEAKMDSYWLGPDGRGEALARMRSVADALGLRFDFTSMDASDCQLAVANGRYDGMLGVAFADTVAWVGAFPPGASEGDRRALFVDGVAVVRERDVVQGETVAEVLRNLRSPIAAVPGSESARALRALGVRIDDRTRNPRGLLDRVLRSPIEAAAMTYGDAAFHLATDETLSARLEIMPQLLTIRA